jgi:hypothetical protein
MSADELAEDKLERLYSNWLSGYPPDLGDVMETIGKFLEQR